MERSIRDWHDTCYEAFAALLSVSSPDTRYSEQLPHDTLVDFIGRFNVWAGNIGAGQQGRASLDYRLREAAYIKEAVIQTLRYLTEAVQEAHAILSGSRPPFDEVSSDSESSDTSGSDDAEQVASSAVKINYALDKTSSSTELQQLQQSISSFIKNLYQISIIIRQNPAAHDRLVRSAKIDTSFFEPWDIRHVQEKFPRADQNLWETLGKANSKRRKYFQYREQHREKLATPQYEVSKDTVGAQNTLALQGGPNSQLAGVQEGGPIDVTTPSVRQPTVAKESTTASTFVPPPVPVPLDLGPIDQQSDTATQTTAESVSSMAQDTLRIPNPPKAAKDAAEFECPYCYVIFRFRSNDPWRRKKEWKQHVLRDLQPYSCTFRGCFQATALYERRGDWMHHEVQHHRKEWSCNAAGHRVHNTRDSFKAHMTSQHSNSFDPTQLDRIIEMMKRPAVHSRFSCPLCHDERYADLGLDQLERHLGRHLQILATFALPSVGSDGRASNDSVAAQDSIPSGAKTNQSSDASELSASLTYHDRDDTAEPSKPGNSDYIVGLGQDDDYPHELAVFLTDVGDKTVTSQIALVCLQKWDYEFWRSGEGIHLNSSHYKVFGPGRNRPLSSPSDICIRELFDGVLKIAGDVLVNRSQLMGDGRGQFRTSLRMSLSHFALTVLSEMGSLEVHQVDLLGPLRQLQTQLVLSLPLEVCALDEDWTFMRLGQSPPQETREISERGKVDSIDSFNHWLAGDDQSALLSDVLRGMCLGTGSWLEETTYFANFRSTKSKVLLVEGLPGCGKTRLCGKVVQALQLDQKSHDSYGLAYYFLLEAVDDVAPIFRALIRQLVRQADRVPPNTQEMFRHSPPSSESILQSQLESILDELVCSFEKTVVVIDALDKVSKPTALVISRFIRRLSNRGIGIQLLATSRLSFNVHDAFWDPNFRNDEGLDFRQKDNWHNDVKTLYIDRHFTNKDIGICARSTIEDNLTLRETGPKFKAILVDSITQLADGVFRIAALQLRRLRSCVSLHNILHEMRSPPIETEGMWREILTRILAQAQTAERSEIVPRIEAVQQVLETLVVSERPLNWKEMDGNLRCDSVHFNDELDVWRQIPALYEIAGEESGSLNLCLSHDSLKDLLKSYAFEASPLGSLAVNTDKAQRNITRRCLVNLLKHQQSSSYTSKFGWTAYAGRYWHKHAKKMADGGRYSPEAMIWRDCTRLLHSNTASFAHWTYMTRPDIEHNLDGEGDFEQNDVYPSPLYYAALLGLLPCAEELIEQGEDVNKEGGRYRYPFLAAVEMGEVELSRLLLQKGANIDSRYANGDTALIRVIKRGHREIFKVLLAAKPALESIDEESSMTAVQWATRFQRLVILEALLEAGARAVPRNELDITPLQWAARNDNVTAMKLLLSAGANVETQDAHNVTALHIAAAFSEQALELLLDRGAKVDAQTLDHRTPLSIAAGGIKPGIVRKLLERGAIVSAYMANDHLASPLHVAAALITPIENNPHDIPSEEVYQIKHQIVTLLIQYGADATYRNWKGQRAEDVAEDPSIKEVLQRAREERELRESSTRSNHGTSTLRAEVERGRTTIESARKSSIQPRKLY